MFDFARVYGPGVTYNPRVAWSGYHMLRRGDESTRDANASNYVTLTGDTPTLIPRGALSETIRALIIEAGLPWLEHAVPYDDEAEYTVRLREHAARSRVVFQHAHAPDPLLDRACWIPRELLTRLNDKGELGNLVPPDSCPPRRVMSVESASALKLEPGATVVFKASTEKSTGSGGAVLIARTRAEMQSVAERFDGCDRVVVEEFQPFTRTMCVNWAADHRGQVEYLGSADQVVADDGTYMSSWIGPDLEPPAEVITVGRGIMERAVELGYVGYAGFDVGLLPNGRGLFFDLNFRICASTPALLLGEEARRRLGVAPWVRLLRLSANLPFDRLCEIGRSLMAEGAFIPLGGFDPTGTVWADRLPSLRGVMIGRNRAETEARCEALLAQGLTFR